MCIQNRDIPIYNPIEPDNFDFFIQIPIIWKIQKEQLNIVLVFFTMMAYF